MISALSAILLEWAGAYVVAVLAINYPLVDDLGGIQKNLLSQSQRLRLNPNQGPRASLEQSQLPKVLTQPGHKEQEQNQINLRPPLRRLQEMLQMLNTRLAPSTLPSCQLTTMLLQQLLLLELRLRPTPILDSGATHCLLPFRLCLDFQKRTQTRPNVSS